MEPRETQVESIFFAALDKASAGERSAYVADACAGDDALRRRVERLLAAQPRIGNFLAGDSPAFIPTIAERPMIEAPGTVIGPYKLLEQIGEGGFGVVFMAEQTAPVKRKVALKVIKPGMDTRQVIARFEAERQALALMDHPNIAKVLDAGATETGRPFFVMELVRGIPITEYCDQSQLSPRERLELFVTVCHAVQHAHQKGIIHRDIKPTNVLITLHDDKPVVKVIDFGVAKATSGQLTDKTLFTGFAQMIGTPLYMSPEQAAMSGLDIDTRSDIYSLGVLLYELLTGTTPFDQTRLQHAAFDEVRRIIREEEPQKPSTRLSSLGATLPSVSAVRKTEPRKLSQLVRGDLDWIVMKALEKDRARRYETANGFALDVMRYLHDEAVLACPPSAGYRFRKFARRNKATLATGAMVAAALVAGIIGTTWQAIRATREANAANAARANEATQTQIAVREKQAAVDARNVAREKETEALAALQEVDRQRRQANENFDKARRAVDAYLNQVTESELLTVPGLQPLREDLLEAALRFYTEFTQERADDPTLQRELASAHYRLGRIHSELGNTEACTTANAEAIRLYERLRDAGHFNPDTQVALAWAYFYEQRYDDTMRLCHNVLLAEAGHAEARSLLADTHNVLGNAADNKADLGTALKHHRQSFELRESLVRDAPDHPRYLAQLGGSVNNLANLLYKQKAFAEALPMFERAAQYTQQAHERAPHSLLWGRWFWICLGNVARTQAALGRVQDSLASYQRHVDVSRKRVFDNPAIASLRGELTDGLLTLARYQQQLGNAAEASRSFREAREVLENIPRETPDQIYELATVYAALAQPPQGAIEPDQEAAAERQRHVELTLQTLHKAIDEGYAKAQTLKTERLFDVLRERAEFQKIVTSLDQAAQAQQLAGRNAGTTEQTLADQQQAAELLIDVVAGRPGALRHRVTLAATLHSIGVIQTGLKQFDEAEQSLRKALEVWDSIRNLQPGKADLEVDAVGTGVALGSLYWSSARFPEGHQTWQECARDLRRLAEAQRADPALQQRVAAAERTICDGYGRYGLWPLAGEYVRRGAEFQWVTGHEQDAEFAALSLLPENADVADGYLGLLAAAPRSSEYPEALRNAHLVRTAALARSTAVTADDLVSRARQALAFKPGDVWWTMVLAIAHYRAGQFQEADDLVRGLGQPGGHAFWRPQVPFVQAITASALGDDSRARSLLASAESLYRQACLESLSHPAVDALGLPSEHWHELIHAQAQRREALRMIQGQEPGDDPWQHLIQARGYRLIGEMELADRELAAAMSGASADPDIWIARARLRTQWDDPERSVEADWRKAVDLAGADPLPWIHRGRWYAERGEQEKADADFAKAASLTPNELNKFLEAGWWVVGPYPTDLREFCPPEVDPDPSQPVHIVDPKAGLSDEPVNWQSFPTGRWGRVDLASAPVRQEGASVYALAYVHSPVEQTKLLMILQSQPLRVWVNGTLVEHYAPGEYPKQPFYDTFHRVPIVLHAGRNAILVKAATADFHVRVGDTPWDSAKLLTEQGRFTEAAQAIGTPPPGDLFDVPGAPSVTHAPLLYMLALADDERYERMAAAQIRNARTDTWTRSWTALVCAQRQTAAFDAHADLLVSYAEEFVAVNGWGTEIAALVNYRAGRYERSRSFVEQRNVPNNLPLRALLAHQNGETALAEETLEQALATGAAYEASLPHCDRSEFGGKHGPAFQWSIDWAQFLTLLREAEQAIRGRTTQSDALRQRCEALAARNWAQSPETIAFDHALLYQSRGSAGEDKFPQPYLTRGRRLAELGRVDEAEADFDKAVELGPNDADALAARGIFLADSGDPDRAAADFNAALNLLTDAAGKPRWAWGVPIDIEVAQRDEVLDRLAALRPDDPRPLMTRMVLRLHQGDFTGARSDADRLASYGTDFLGWRAAEALWRGDLEAFKGLRAAVPRIANPYSNIVNLSLGATEEPLTTELLQQADRMSREQPQDHLRRRALGLVQLRAAEFDEAAATLEASLRPGNGWQQDGEVWPLLAIAHHRLGNTDAARRWLRKAELWLELRNAAESRQIGSAGGVGNIRPGDVLFAMVYYLEAKSVLDGPDAAAEMRDLLATKAREQNQSAQARADARRQAALARAEADWQRTVDLAGDDPAPWMQRARWYAGRGELGKAEADWQRAVELAGADPSVWIQRGRWFAERGEQDKANADFAKAASLTPGELNRFLAAGWWVAGPYPPELEQFCPPEVDPDQSRPVAVIDPKAGLSDTLTPWVSVPTGAYGSVDLSGVLDGRTANSFYALAQVWSPDERSVLLMLGRTEPLRVWVNGVLIEDFAAGEPPGFPWYEPFHRVPVALQAGRNSVLIKCAGPTFTVRIGDTPRDRALLLVEQRRFTAARDVLHELPFSPADLNSGVVTWWLAPVLAMGDGPHDLYESHCAAAIARIAEAEHLAWLRPQIFWVCSQRPNQHFDQHADRLASFAEQSAEENPGAGTRLHAALANYRAGHYERARSLLTQEDLSYPPVLPLLALLQHQSGDASAARESLDAALGMGAQQVERMATADRSDFVAWIANEWWCEWATFLNLLTEAEQAIRGESTAAARLKATAEATAERRWTESPELAAFDHAVLLTARSPDGGLLPYAQLYSARGRRLAELGRNDAAEADFNKAVELSPNDADVLTARAVFLADSGRPDRAAADFHAALSLFSDSGEKPRWKWGVPIDLEVARREEVFEQLTVLRPEDLRPLMTRMVLRMLGGDADGAHADAERLASSGRAFRPLYAAEALWRGDVEEFDRIREAGSRFANPMFNVLDLGLAPTREPMTSTLLQEAERMWREQPQHGWNRRWLGLAQLRAGQYREALASLEASLTTGNYWQEGDYYPLLAMAHHHLGNKEAARLWLDKTTSWLELWKEAESRRAGSNSGVGNTLPEYVLYALVLHREAKALIEGDAELP